jgi:ribonuclease HI
MAEWRRIGAAELIEEGIRPEWRDARSPLRLESQKRQHQYLPGDRERTAYQQLLEEELREGVIAPIPDGAAKWINPTCLVLKKSGKFRKVLDCRQLNSEIEDRSFRMEGAEDLIPLLQAGDYATSLDFRNAFNHVPVSEDLKPYLCFRYRDQTFAYQGMPFGIRHAPRVFTRVMRAAVREVRTRWAVRMISYMDDSLLLFHNLETARSQTMEIAGYFQSLGWTMSWDKCQLEPQHTAEFLGWSWNLETLQLSMTAKRRAALLAELTQWIRRAEERAWTPTREVAALAGRLNFLRLQVQEASLYTQRLHSAISTARRHAGWNGLCQLNPTVLGELKWWASRISGNIPRELAARPQSMTVTTDASPAGWGAEIVHGPDTTHMFGVWSPREAALTSNAKELTAVRKALEHAHSHSMTEQGTRVLVRSDNTTTVFIIKAWSTRLTLLRHLRTLHNLTKRLDIQLETTYLPGALNSVADRLSRLGTAMDFALKRDIFLRVTEELELNPEIDVFADETNHLVDTYASLSPTDGAACAVDGFTLSWENRALWLHPPIRLIGRVLAKISLEGARVILVTPAWEGQTWSPQLRALALRQSDLGEYDTCMTPGRRFLQEGWRLPPGRACATLMDTRTTRGSSSSKRFSPDEAPP